MRETLQIMTPEMKMADLLHQNFELLFVISRLNISLGFGDKTVEQVCVENNLETQEFLTLVRLHLSPCLVEKRDLDLLSPKLIISYLKNSHDYFLKQRLPDIKKKLNEVLLHTDFYQLIIPFFEEYEKEVAEHMIYEDEVFFPYAMKLLSGKSVKKYTTANYESRHDNIEEKMTDLLSLLIKYLPNISNAYLVSNLLLDLNLCHEDLKTHSFLEEEVLIPKIKKIEENEA